MATIYSLICWGGKDGKAVTCATTDIITLANHGLYDGTGVVPQSTVSGVTSGTTYYTKSLSTNTFELYHDSALTSKVDITGTTGFTLKSAYYTGLTDKTRWTQGGVELIYNGIKSWRDSRYTTASQFDHEVCEICEPFVERQTSNLAIDIPSGATTITTRVNGAWSLAAHGGRITSGYMYYSAGGATFGLSKYNSLCEGFVMLFDGSGPGSAKPGNIYQYMIFRGNGTGTGYSASQALGQLRNSIVTGFAYGVTLNQYQSGLAVTNCLITKNTTYGVYTQYGGTSGFYGFFYNNIVIGNGTNWYTQPTGLEGCSHNTGETTDTNQPWATTGGSHFDIDTTAFVDYLNNDFYPASASSPQVNTGLDFYGISRLDIAGKYSPDYEAATYPNNIPDIGPFEYDHGEGNTPPNYRNFTINGLVSGSRVKIKKTADGTVIHNAVVSSTSLTISYNAGTANTPVTIDIRKGSAAPYYKPYRTTSSISYLADTEISVAQIEAIAASTYDADVATDWSINTGTKAITRNSGGQYSLQYLYSWLLDYYDDESTVDLDMPIEGITPAQFELINSGSISDADMQYLNGGSLWDGTTLWANLTVVGTLVADTTVYVHVDGTEYPGYWGTGNIDVSLKFQNFDGTEVVDVRAHKYTDTYDHWRFDGLGEGLNYAALSTADDPNNQTAEVTVADYDITVTVDNPTDKAVDAEDTPADYTTTVDANGLGVQEVYEYLKYLTKEKSTYISANAAFDEVKSAPYGTFAGGIFFGARGIWLENVASGDALNHVLTDNDGVTHQASAPPVSITVTNIVAGSRIQVYDITNSTELANEIVAGTSYSLEKTWTEDLDIRIRLMHQDGATAYEFYEAQGSFTSTGMAMRASQTADVVYNVNAIDGSTITDLTINDGLLLVSVSTGAITWQQLYAYETYWLYTEEGIRDEGRFAVAQDPANYLWYDFKIKNTTDPTVPLVVTGGYGRDGDTGAALNMIDTSGGTIIFAPDHVVAYAAGAEATVAIVQSGLTAQGYSTARAGKLDNLDIPVSEAGGGSGLTLGQILALK